MIVASSPGHCLTLLSLPHSLIVASSCYHSLSRVMSHPWSLPYTCLVFASLSYCCLILIPQSFSRHVSPPGRCLTPVLSLPHSLIVASSCYHSLSRVMSHPLVVGSHLSCLCLILLSLPHPVTTDSLSYHSLTLLSLAA